MALDEQITGSPPAVTYEMLVEWQALADDVTAAIAMGGEQGLDLLKGLMPEWCEAVDDVNAAREICVKLASAGRRQEALEWHADGFFDVADLISPDRAGWEEWESALASRNIPVPALSQQLRHLADRLHEDLLVRDLSGLSLAEYVNLLRRNVLAKAAYGERMTILETIRRFDPGGSIWKEMIEPIRRKRAVELVGEFAAAIQREDFVATSSLSREVAATTWDSGIPGELQTFTEAIDHWRKARDFTRSMSAALSTLIERGQLLHEIMQAGAANRLEFNSVFEQARAERSRFLTIREQLQTAISVACRAPLVAAKVSSEALVEEARAAVDRAKPWIDVIDRARDYEKWVSRFRHLQTQLDNTTRNAPLEGGSWDEAKLQCGRWLQRVAAILSRCKELNSRSPITAPQSFIDERLRLEEAARLVTKRKKDIGRKELTVVLLVLSGLILIVGVFLVLLLMIRA